MRKWMTWSKEWMSKQVSASYRKVEKWRISTGEERGVVVLEVECCGGCVVTEVE